MSKNILKRCFRLKYTFFAMYWIMPVIFVLYDGSFLVLFFKVIFQTALISSISIRQFLRVIWTVLLSVIKFFIVSLTVLYFTNVFVIILKWLFNIRCAFITFLFFWSSEANCMSQHQFSTTLPVFIVLLMFLFIANVSHSQLCQQRWPTIEKYKSL